MAEHQIVDLDVVGSSPIRRPKPSQPQQQKQRYTEGTEEAQRYTESGAVYPSIPEIEIDADDLQRHLL